MPADGANWLSQLARSIFAGARRIVSPDDEHASEDVNESPPNQDRICVTEDPSTIIGTDSCPPPTHDTEVDITEGGTSSAHADDTTNKPIELESAETESGRASSRRRRRRVTTSPFEGYHLDINMSSFYSQAIKSLPRYRRDDTETADYGGSYVPSNTSDIPCSPRLVQRSTHQRRVITRMLRSYPQPDGSFVCPIRQPGQHTAAKAPPPPLPAKARDRQQPKVTVPIPYRRNNSSYELTSGSHQPIYQSSQPQRARSISHQPIAVASNDVCTRQHYLRTNSYPNNSSIPSTSHSSTSTLIISTQSPQPALHAITPSESDVLALDQLVEYQYTTATANLHKQPDHEARRNVHHKPTDQHHTTQHHTTELHHATVSSHRPQQQATNPGRRQADGLGTPPYYAKAKYFAEPYSRLCNGATSVSRSDSQLSSMSEASSSTYTGSVENPKRNGSPDWEGRGVDSMSSSVEGGTGNEDSTNPDLPELYPEQRVDLPLRIKPRSQLKMTCFDMLHNAHHVLEFLSHKVDILEQSLQLFTDKLSEMSDLAVTTPRCTKIDTEFCICHQIFDSAKLGHGIWKYFCDADKCNFCCQLFEQLANRPTRSCQLSVLDLNLNLILSEALIITGEDNGGLVVFVQAQSAVWANCDEDCLLDLSNFLEYISSTIRNGLISVIVDTRQSPEPINQLIMDSLNNAQRNSKGGIAEASFIVGRPTNTTKRPQNPLGVTSKSTVVDIEFCSLSDCVLKLSPEKLPAHIGGTYRFDPDSWIRSYACLEKKVQQHQRAFGEIFHSTHSLSLVPRTIRHAGNVIHQHKNAVDVVDRTTKLLDRSKYTEEGSRYPSDVDDANSGNILRDAEIRQLLEDLNTFMTGTHVFRDVMDSLQSLGQTGRVVARLKVLAESRLTKLNGCQKLWYCIEEITKTLTLLRRAHDLINKHRVISNNLKSAQVQFNNFNKIRLSVMKLLAQGNDLLAESHAVLADVKSPIPWLEQLSAKLQSELSFLASFLEKTRLLVTDAYHCYSTLDQAYDWAVESMKFVSTMSMDDCLTEEGIERLSANLHTFIKEHKPIDKKVFDEVTLKAKNLGNKKLMEQCKIARSRCEETKQVLKVRETTIIKAKEEIEALKAKRISMQQLAAGTNIAPLISPASNTSIHVPDEDIWLPQESTPTRASPHTPKSSLRRDDSNNNSTASKSRSSSEKSSEKHMVVQSVRTNHARTRSEDTGLALSDLPGIPNTLTESLDTMASSSQEDILSREGSQSDILTKSSDKSHTVSPIASDQLKEDSMIKRRSFAGFTLSQPVPQFDNLSKMTKTEDNSKRLSDDLSELDEGLAIVDDDSSCTSGSMLSKSVVEKLEELGMDQQPGNKMVKKKDVSLRDSVITGSSDSLTSYHDDQEVLTEDSGALTKSSSSTTSHDSNNGQPVNQWSPVPVNSHLLQKKTSHQWQSMADLRLTETEIRSRRTLSHIMDELVQTEKDYVMALKLVVDRYIPEMNREDVPQLLRGNRGVIFGNIEKIYDFHNHFFLKKLLECDKEPFRISQCFLHHEKEFMLYALYNKNKPKSDCLMAEHGSTFFRELQNKMGDKMDLSSYLLKPVQRMGKYALILKQILKECPESAAEYQDLSAAQDMIKFCLQHGNDLLAMDALKECDVNLQEQGTLLLQEEFVVQKSRHKAAKRHIFLFDDLLVFAKAKKLGAGTDEYVYKTSLKTADLGLTENVGSSGCKFEIWFRKRSRDNWTLQAPSPQIKNKWVSTFEKILWNQAIKNRESRLTELSSMGIGSKPSFDLKPSEDNINDRTINPELTHKVIQRKSTLDSGKCEDSPKSTVFPRKSTSGSTKSRTSSTHSGNHGKLPPHTLSAGSTSSVYSLSASSTSSCSTTSHSKAVENSALNDTPGNRRSGLHITSTNGSIFSKDARKRASYGDTPTNSTSAAALPRGMDRSDSGVSGMSSRSIQSPSREQHTSPSSSNVLTLLEEPLSAYESNV